MAITHDRFSRSTQIDLAKVFTVACVSFRPPVRSLAVSAARDDMSTARVFFWLAGLLLPVLTHFPPLLLSRSYEVSAGADHQDRRLHHHPKTAKNVQIRNGPAAGAIAHLQPHLHRLWANPGILDLAQRSPAP